MNPRWRNLGLLLLLGIFAAALYGWVQSSGSIAFFSQNPLSIRSFDQAQAAVSNVLLSYDWFEPSTQLLNNPDSAELAQARTRLQNLKIRIHQNSFS